MDRAAFLRPFWPGGDYEHFDYPEGCVVVDNPPFSILAAILRFYTARRIQFFLFAPTLTLFAARKVDVSYIPCGVKITYANGANVNTSFVTSLESCRLRSAPGLYAAVRRENDINAKAMTKKLPTYRYPDHVLTAAAAYQYSQYGVDFRLEKADCVFIRKLDAMKAKGKDSGIFGGAYLLSDRAAADRAAADRAAADRAAADRAAAEAKDVHVWQLSDRERQVVAGLSQKSSPLHSPDGPALQKPSPLGEGGAKAPGEVVLADLFDLDRLMRLEA